MYVYVFFFFLITLILESKSLSQKIVRFKQKKIEI